MGCRTVTLSGVEMRALGGLIVMAADAGWRVTVDDGGDGVPVSVVMTNPNGDRVVLRGADAVRSFGALVDAVFPEGIPL